MELRQPARTSRDLMVCGCCRYYLMLGRDLSYGNTKELPSSSEEVSRLLNAYSKAIQAAAGGHSNS